jgi:hypothetical protein
LLEVAEQATYSSKSLTIPIEKLAEAGMGFGSLAMAEFE